MSSKCGCTITSTPRQGNSKQDPLTFINAAIFLCLIMHVYVAIHFIDDVIMLHNLSFE